MYEGRSESTLIGLTKPLTTPLASHSQANGPEVEVARTFSRVKDMCVFRTKVTGRFGIVTGDFGNVTGRFGNVTVRPDDRTGVAHDINHASYARRLWPEKACPRTG
jgi:hypothetical protein